MECEKRYFTVYHQGKEINDQFYLDEDFNVPDMKRDVQRIILTEGKVHIEDIKRVENYVRVTGEMLFKILYVTDEGETKITSLDGKLPFEEMVYTDEEPLENIFVKCANVDLAVNVIHSRKLNLKAIIDMKLSSDGQKEEEILSDVTDNISLYKKYEEYPVLRLYAIKKDTYRIKEEIVIGGTKETIGALLWSDVINRRLDTRVGADEIILQGELLFFGFYESIDGKLDWIEQTVPYQGRIYCYGVQDDMYHQIYPEIRDISIDVRMDEDGEMRIIGVEATLAARIIFYEEESMKILDDIYSLEKKCELTREKKHFETLLVQNHSKCKIAERLSLPEIKDNILQICHSSAKIQIENVGITERGLLMEGILHVNFMYVKPDDVIPFDVWQGMVPFSYLLESTETGPDMSYDLLGTVEQLSIGLLGNDEIEVKAVLAIRSFLKKPVIFRDITDVSYGLIDFKEQENAPGIIGYIVKDGDKLWDLAKKYNTTVESIVEVNNLDQKELKSGQKMLIFKENMSIL